MVLNVVVGGISIGLTRRLKEAEEWLAASKYEGKKEIIMMRP